MPPRTPSHRPASAGRTASTASMIAAGTSAPTLALVDEVLGLDASVVTWTPAPLSLVASSGVAGGGGDSESPALRLLPGLDER